MLDANGVALLLEGVDPSQPSPNVVAGAAPGRRGAAIVNLGAHTCSRACRQVVATHTLTTLLNELRAPVRPARAAGRAARPGRDRGAAAPAARRRRAALTSIVSTFGTPLDIAQELDRGVLPGRRRDRGGVAGYSRKPVPAHRR
jgi:hypothetical protein